MIWRALADLVVVAHFAFILFVVLGALALLHRPRLVWIHLPAVAWGMAIELGGWLCPLTPLENALRARGGAPTYASAFIEHYLVPLVYPAALTHRLQIVLASAALAANAILYALVLRRWRAGRARRAADVEIRDPAARPRQSG